MRFNLHKSEINSNLKFQFSRFAGKIFVSFMKQHFTNARFCARFSLSFNDRISQKELNKWVEKQ